jgi:hypothetical protein
VWIEGGWIGNEVFRDNFDVAPTSTDWELVDGSFGEITITSVDDAIATNSNLAYGDNSGDDELWLVSKKLFPYDPNKIYEVEIRTKRSGSGDGLTYCGLQGYASDKTTKVSTTGANSFDNAHYITLSGYDQTTTEKWQTFRGYVSGNSTTAAVQSNNINTASTAYTDVAFISPMFLINYNDQAGEVLIDHIVVREFTTDIPNATNWYSTLNRNYYVPVLVKDASFTTFDEENLQKCNLQYIESKPKRTIR